MKYYFKTGTDQFLSNILFLFLLVFCVNSFATPYYVDNSLTSGLNDGSTPGNAWQTLDGPNNHTFLAGDFLLLKRGTGKDYTYTSESKKVYRGTCTIGNLYGVLAPLGKGSPSSPITIDAYGTGPGPVINASTFTNCAGILLYNQNYWTINNIVVCNNANTIAYRWGILAFFPPDVNDITYHGITITNDTIRNVYAAPHDNIYKDPNDIAWYCTGGIYVWAEANSILSFISTTKPSSRIDGVLIANNVLSNITACGIYFKGESQYNPDVLNGQLPVDPTTGACLDVVNWKNLSTNVIVRGNIVKNVCEGIIVVGAENPIIEYNTVDNAGGMRDAKNSSVNAIWTQCTNNGLIQYNEVMRTKAPDGIGLHTDIVHKGTITIQYNYSHENQGGFFSGFWPDVLDYSIPKIVFRYNVSVNDINPTNGDTKIYFSQNPVDFYNNTVYSTGPINILNNNRPNYSVPTGIRHNYQNNIFYSTSVSPSTFQSNSLIKYDNNLYSTNLKNKADLYAKYSNIVFQDPGRVLDGIENTSGYRLLINSPGREAGLTILNNGGKDFKGVNIIGRPDIGAYEFPRIIVSYTNPLLGY